MVNIDNYVWGFVGVIVMIPIIGLGIAKYSSSSSEDQLSNSLTSTSTQYSQPPEDPTSNLPFDNPDNATILSTEEHNGPIRPTTQGGSRRKSIRKQKTKHKRNTKKRRHNKSKFLTQKN